MDLGEGRWLAGLGLVALTLGLSALAFSFALATAERWYYSGWAGMQVVAYQEKTGRHDQARRDRHNPFPGMPAWPERR